MDDRDIIALYWQRAERAIHETAAKYGGLCYTIAHNILSSREGQRGVRQRHLSGPLERHPAPKAGALFRVRGPGDQKPGPEAV